MFIIITTILLTVVIMQNTDTVRFDFLFWTSRPSKLVVLLIIAVVSFIIGVMVGRPGRPKYIPGQVQDPEVNKKEDDTLSDEDREYIS
jgi:hypothetical protein